jgi:hypothetical protein
MNISLHIRQIQKYLKDNFFEAIKLTIEEENRKPQEIEQLKFSRSLVGMSICMNSELMPHESVNYITDGFGDDGIDGIYYDNAEKCLYLIQSKFSYKGEGSLDLGDAHKYLAGVRNLISGNKFQDFNERIRERGAEIEKYLMDIQTRFVLTIIVSGNQVCTGDVKKLLEGFCEENNELSDSFSLIILNNQDLYNFIASGVAGKPIDSQVALYQWSHVSEPLKSYYGQIAGSDLGKLFESYGRNLFAPNIRVYLGGTEVNEGIIETIENNPTKFWYYNNGITLLCDSIDKKPIGGLSAQTGIFDCKNIRIVNGAQTVGSIAKALKLHPENTEIIRVWIRIVEVSEQDVDESRKITRTNNTQNRIDSRDFVSLDPQQKRIHDDLLVERIMYRYKSGETVDPDVEGFDLNDATVARACVQSEISYAVQAKREISKLWGDIEKAPYKILFNGTLQGTKLVWEVRIQRLIDKLIIGKQKDVEGRDRLLVTHGNRFLLFMVFRSLDEQNRLYQAIDEESLTAIFESSFRHLKASIDKLHNDAVLGSLFKNLSKCKHVFDDITQTKNIEPFMNLLFQI